MGLAVFLARNGITSARPAFLGEREIASLAARLGVTVRAAMALLLDGDVWPERFRRNQGVLTAGAQKRLLELRLFVAGCGGLGGEFASLLCRMGAGCLRICDPDVFEASNLNRQRFCTESSLGQPKAAVVREGLLAIASYLEIEALQVAVTPANLEELLSGVDVVVDCLDSVSRKKMLEQGAAAAKIPYLHGSVLATEGFAWLDIPARQRLAALYPDITAADKSAGPEPVLATTVTGTAALMASLLLNGLILDGACQSPLCHLDCSVPELDTFLV